MQKKKDKNDDELKASFHIYPPNAGRNKKDYGNLTKDEIRQKIMKKLGPKYIQKLCHGICHLNFKLEVNNPDQQSDGTTKIDERTMYKIKSLLLEDECGNVLEGEYDEYHTGIQKYPDATLEKEVELRYLECVMNNMDKSIWVNLVPLQLSYPSAYESTPEEKIFYYEADKMYSKIKYLNKLLNENEGGWHAPLSFDGGYIKKTNIFNQQTISKKVIIWKEYSEKEFPIQNKKNWIPPADDYTLKVINYIFSILCF